MFGSRRKLEAFVASGGKGSAGVDAAGAAAFSERERGGERGGERASACLVLKCCCDEMSRANVLAQPGCGQANDLSAGNTGTRAGSATPTAPTAAPTAPTATLAAGKIAGVGSGARLRFFDAALRVFDAATGATAAAGAGAATVSSDGLSSRSRSSSMAALLRARGRVMIGRIGETGLATGLARLADVAAVATAATAALLGGGSSIDLSSHGEDPEEASESESSESVLERRTVKVADTTGDLAAETHAEG